MFKLDHFVVNVGEEYQKDDNIVNNILAAGLPYEPTWGKGTKGFKASNIWIGNEYFEMINIISPKGGGWKAEWVEFFNNGHRGLICLMLDVKDIEDVYQDMEAKGMEITIPENLKFKWFFNILTRTMPWKNSYIKFFEGIPLQIGFQQMDDDKARSFMEQYMIPNSRDNNIDGVNKVVIKGPLTIEDKRVIEDIFGVYRVGIYPITIKLNNEQTLIFEEDDEYSVDIFTRCNNNEFLDKSIKIENINIYNEESFIYEK